MKFHILSTAHRDYVRAARWYLEDQQSPQSAEGFATEVARVYREIQRDPTRYPPRHRGLRSWPLRKYPFFVIYRFKTNEIAIASLKHDKRDSKYLEQFT